MKMGSILFLILSFSYIPTRGFSQEHVYPGGTALTIWDLVTNGIIEHFFGCRSYESFTENDIAYYLHTRQTIYPIRLTQNNLQNSLNVTKDTKIIFNGWLGTAHDDYILKLVIAYLTRYDCNVITVEYINLTNTQYSQAYCNTIVGSHMISDVFCELHHRIELDFNEKVHMVGLSMGAQIAGLIGQQIQQKCNQKVNRITGLDPAGPIYYDQDISMRLDKTDGQFVDVIHTNMELFGYYGAIGHVDFYPNCGIVQPGCFHFDIFNLMQTIHNFISCSHERSIHLFTESVYMYGPTFNSTSCSLCPLVNEFEKCNWADLVNPQYAVMGEDCPRNPPATKFVLQTNSYYPYAQG